MPSKQTLSSNRFFIVNIILTAAVATLFGFAAGLVASSGRLTGGLFQMLPAAVRQVIDPAAGQFQSGAERYSLPQLRGRLKQTTSEQAAIEVVKKSSPAVVSIVVSKDMPVYEQYLAPQENDDLFQQFFGDMPGLQFNVPQYRQNGTAKQEIGAGSGFLISADGYIVTNRHVVADEKASYTVVLQDQRKFEAKVLGRDAVSDIAVLKIEGMDFPFVALGDSDKLQVGQSVIAIGYALGRFSNSVSFGIISGLQRSLTANDGLGGSQGLFDVIQSDAAINPGNSGGPLLNLKSEVIGVNVAIVQGSQNISFSLPINDVKTVVSSLRATGKIVRPFLGVRFVMISKELQAANQLSVDHGALVVRGQAQTDLAVMPGSPADLAGIVENDIILEINGKELTADYPLQLAVTKLAAGDTVKLKILHKGEEKVVEVKLTEKK
ncbi:MAG: trypsin-like peptidase domain-containing protein [Patescibacteria group bacterium]